MKKFLSVFIAIVTFAFGIVSGAFAVSIFSKKERKTPDEWVSLYVLEKVYSNDSSVTISAYELETNHTLTENQKYYAQTKKIRRGFVVSAKLPDSPTPTYYNAVITYKECKHDILSRDTYSICKDCICTITYDKV